MNRHEFKGGEPKEVQPDSFIADLVADKHALPNTRFSKATTILTNILS